MLDTKKLMLILLDVVMEWQLYQRKGLKLQIHKIFTENNKMSRIFLKNCPGKKNDRKIK